MSDPTYDPVDGWAKFAEKQKVRLRDFHADVLGGLAKHTVTPAEGYLKSTSPRASTDIDRAIREAVQAEREACAKVAENKYGASATVASTSVTGHAIAYAIRARGEREG